MKYNSEYQYILMLLESVKPRVYGWTLGRLKGEYEALELAAIQKRCDIIQELKEAREERKRREKEAEAKEKLEEQSIVDEL
uniref:hypothetical protein n=1 Tax=Thiolapillus sp. TaxID=2017437 RepID=UPI003AF7B2C6